MNTAWNHIWETKEIQIKEPKLVQRIWFRDKKINFDSMWASEFDWWAIPKTLDRILEIKWAWKLIKKSFILNFSPNVLIDKWTVVEIVCNADDFEEIKTQIEFLLLEEYRLTESMHLEYIHSDSNTNFFCLDNTYFFSLDWHWDDFLKFLEDFKKPKDEVVDESEIIKEELSLKDEQKEEKYYSWNDNRVFRILLEKIKHELVNNFVSSGFMPLEELSKNQYLSKENLEKLFDILIFLFNKYRNLFIHDSWLNLFSNMMAHINSTRSIRMQSKKHIKTIEWWLKWRKTYKTASRKREHKLFSIASETIKTIKQIYTSWIPFDGNWDPKNHFSWYKPLYKNINFHNNLHRLWFKCKELNVYVDPKKYQKQPNEILIWEPEHNGASVWTWPLNYSRMIFTCLDMEKLTWVKMISNWNQMSPGSILDNHYLQRIFDWKFWENKISWSFICYIYNLISFNDNNIPSEKEFENVKQFLSENDLQKIIFQYLSQNFPGERTIEEYQQTARETMDILLVKIAFYNLALQKLDQKFSFEDRMKKAERIWYKNRNVLEKTRSVMALYDITKGLFEKPKNPADLVEEWKEKVEEVLGYFN